MQVSQIKLSIIIVSYNTRDTTRNCIKSIYSSEIRFPFEIIVIDNNSKDGSKEMLEYEFPNIKLIKNTENLLFAKANNQGADIASGEYLLLLNSDTLVYSDNIDKMIVFLDSLPDDVICIGPKLLNADKSIQSHGYPLPSKTERFCMCFKINRIIPFAEKLFRINGLPDKHPRTKRVGWVSGACMMVRAEQFRQIGGLNENIEFYGEEPEFGYRSFRKYGYKTIYYNEAEIIHLGGKSTSTTKQVPDEIRLRRYALLQKYTVGYKEAIKMSEIVLIANIFKRIASITPPRKNFFNQAIAWERKVIFYLKQKKNEEIVD